MGQRVRSTHRHVPAFSIDKYKGTNREYLDFVDAGGYDNPAFLDRMQIGIGITTQKIRRPAIFGGASKSDGFTGQCLMKFLCPLDWPVYVSQA